MDEKHLVSPKRFWANCDGGLRRTTSSPCGLTKVDWRWISVWYSAT